MARPRSRSNGRRSGRASTLAPSCQRGLGCLTLLHEVELCKRKEREPSPRSAEFNRYRTRPWGHSRLACERAGHWRCSANPQPCCQWIQHHRRILLPPRYAHPRSGPGQDFVAARFAAPSLDAPDEKPPSGAIDIHLSPVKAELEGSSSSSSSSGAAGRLPLARICASC